MANVLEWGLPPRGVFNFPMHLGKRTGLIGPEYAITENITGQDYTRELIGRRYDVGFMGTPPFFAALAAGAPYGMIGQAVYDYPPFDLMVRPGIESLADLAGATIAINKLQTCPHSIVRTALHQQGMAEDAVQLSCLVTGDAILDAVEAGEVQAATIWEPYAAYIKEHLGWTTLLEGRDVINPSNYGMVIYASNELIMTDAPRVNAFLDTYLEAIRQAKETEDIEWFSEMFDERLRPYVEPALRRERALWSIDPRVDWAFMYRVQDELSAQGVIPDNLVLEDHIFDGFSKYRAPSPV